MDTQNLLQGQNNYHNPKYNNIEQFELHSPYLSDNIKCNSCSRESDDFHTFGSPQMSHRQKSRSIIHGKEEEQESKQSSVEHRSSSISSRVRKQPAQGSSSVKKVRQEKVGQASLVSFSKDHATSGTAFVSPAQDNETESKISTLMGCQEAKVKKTTSSINKDQNVTDSEILSANQSNFASQVSDKPSYKIIEQGDQGKIFECNLDSKEAGKVNAYFGRSPSQVENNNHQITDFNKQISHVFQPKQAIKSNQVQVLTTQQSNNHNQYSIDNKAFSDNKSNEIDCLTRINPSFNTNLSKQSQIFEQNSASNYAYKTGCQSNELVLPTRHSSHSHILSVEEEIMKNYQDKVRLSALVSPDENGSSRHDSNIIKYDAAQFGSLPNQHSFNNQGIDPQKLQNDDLFAQNLAGNFYNEMTSVSNEEQSDQEIQPGMQVHDLAAQRIFKLINEQNLKGLIEHLKLSNHSFDLTIMKDALNFSLLTYCAYRNDANCFKVIFEYAWRKTIPNENRRSRGQEDKIRNWVNMKTNENFTALHYVAQNGNYSMLTLLVEKGGADLNIRNKFGASVMHIAAQKDQALSIYYFAQRGVDINIKDQKNCTPLHWACYKGSEIALIYILSLKPDLEARDVRGLTPLHIAVNSVGRLGNTRCVKTLLISGSNRIAKDNDGKIPLEWVQEDQSDYVKDELKQYLSKQSYCECLLLRIPLTPLKRNHKTQCLFVLLFMVVYMLSLLIVQPKLSKYGYEVLMTSSISTMVVFLTFFYTSCKDPGVISPEKNRSFLELLRDINPADLCPDCRIIKTARSRHCAICNQCVERFDHHCPWINNCVGIKNHNAFMLFVLSIWLKIVIHASLTVFSIINTFEYGFNECKGDLCNELCIYNLCNQPIIFFGSCLVCLLICIFYFILSTLLLYIHIKNYLANKTTSERLSSNKKSRKKRNKQQSEMVTDSESSDQSSSILSYSDFDKSQTQMIDNSKDNIDKEPINKPIKPPKKKGCCINIWKMTTHTRIVPQDKLYRYLADRSIEIDADELQFSNFDEEESRD